MTRSVERPHETWKSWLAVGVAIALTAIVQLTTNSSAVGEFSDPYTVIAESGLSPNPQLVSPCAYRFVSPMLAGAAARLCGLSTADGFFVVSMAASVLLLWLTCCLAVRLGASFTGGLTAMAVIGLSIGHLKNNLYFNNSMEAVTQVLMFGWCLAMFRRHWLIATFVCVVGLCTRELFLIPSALLCGRLLVLWWQAGAGSGGLRRAVMPDLQFVGSVAFVIAAFVLPRLFIPVAATIQLIDPLYDDGWFTKLLQVPLNWKRDLNIVAGVLGYALPLLMLVTRERWRSAWIHLRPYRLAGAAYCGMWLVLTLWGGTDLYRYVTYLFLPLVFVMAGLFAERQSHPRIAEIMLALLAVVVQNRTFSHIPAIADNLEAYLDFWPAFEDRLNWAAFIRLAQAASFVGAAFALRWLLSRRLIARSDEEVASSAPAAARRAA